MPHQSRAETETDPITDENVLDAATENSAPEEIDSDDEIDSGEIE